MLNSLGYRHRVHAVHNRIFPAAGAVIWPRTAIGTVRIGTLSTLCRFMMDLTLDPRQGTAVMDQ